MTPIDIARAGALRLADLVCPNGRFTYAYRIGGEPLGGYNLLRHCGAIWAMAEIANSQPDLRSVGKAALRALSWVMASKTQRIETGLCLTGSRPTAKLGGAALAVLACLEVNGRRRHAKLLEAAKRFGMFLVMMRLPNGDFVHKLHLETMRALPFRSEYYTGEALFALARLSAETGDPRWLDPAVDSIHKLAPLDYGVAEQSHWMLYALDLISRSADPDACIRYGAKIVENILDQPAYRARRQSTPTACRSEGMLAFLRMTEGASDPGIIRLRHRALTAVEQNLAMQQSFFHESGAFIHGDRSDDVRIDYIQHNVSSFHAYDRFINGTRPSMRG